MAKQKNVVKGNTVKGDHNLVANSIQQSTQNNYFQQRIQIVISDISGLKEENVECLRSIFNGSIPEKLQPSPNAGQPKWEKEDVFRMILDKVLLHQETLPKDPGELTNCLGDQIGTATEDFFRAIGEKDPAGEINNLSKSYLAEIKERLDQLSDNDAAILERLDEKKKRMLQIWSDLHQGNFSLAEDSCKRLLEKHHKYAEAYFCRALARCQIRLIWDYVEGKYQPILYDWKNADLSAAPDYLTALECAAKEERKHYEAVAEEVGLILKQLKEFQKFEISDRSETGSSLNCDCFICSKIHDENEQYTEDHKYVVDEGLYRALKEAGLKPFYSEIDLTDYEKGNYQYNSAILYALSRAKCMILVCGKEEYLNTPWVQNEYSWFRAYAKKQGLDWNDRLIVVFKEKRIKPNGRHSYCQDFDRTKASLDTLVKRVGHIIGSAKKDDADRLNVEDGSFVIRNGILEQFRGSEEAVSIPDGVISIEKKAFENCVNVKSVVIPDSVVQIGDNAFDNCASLYSVTVPNGVQEIGVYAFNNCSALTSVIISDSVTKIGEMAFFGCVRLREITIPFVGEMIDGTRNRHFGFLFGAKNAEENATAVPASLKKVTVTGGSDVDADAFYGCASLSSVTIGAGVTGIGDWAFSACSGLTTVTVSDSVARVGARAFDDCVNLETIYCDAPKKPWGWSRKWRDGCEATVVWGKKKPSVNG